jgi:hypothetical protein
MSLTVQPRIFTHNTPKCVAILQGRRYLYITDRLEGMTRGSISRASGRSHSTGSPTPSPPASLPCVPRSGRPRSWWTSRTLSTHGARRCRAIARHSTLRTRRAMTPSPASWPGRAPVASPEGSALRTPAGGQGRGPSMPPVCPWCRRAVLRTTPLQPGATAHHPRANRLGTQRFGPHASRAAAWAPRHHDLAASGR